MSKISFEVIDEYDVQKAMVRGYASTSSAPRPYSHADPNSRPEQFKRALAYLKRAAKAKGEVRVGSVLSARKSLLSLGVKPEELKFFGITGSTKQDIRYDLKSERKFAKQKTKVYLRIADYLEYLARYGS